MMRILRLYAPSLIGDHTLCYVSTRCSGPAPESRSTARNAPRR